MAVEDDNKEKDKEPKKRRVSFKFKLSRELVVRLILLTNVICMAAGVYYAYMGTMGLTKEALTEMQAKKELYKSDIFDGKPIIFSLDPFTVNLAGEDSRIIQIKVSLEMIDEDGFEEVVTMGSHARDTIVHILNGKTYSDIETIQGKLFLKDEITIALNKQLQRSFIKDIHFSSFVIQ